MPRRRASRSRRHRWHPKNGNPRRGCSESPLRRRAPSRPPPQAPRHPAEPSRLRRLSGAVPRHLRRRARNAGSPVPLRHGPRARPPCTATGSKELDIAGACTGRRAGLGDTRLVRRLQRLDARRLPVVHDEGAVVQLRDAGVELAQELEDEGLVGLLLLLVEPAALVVRVKLVVGRIQFANLVVALSAVGFLNLVGEP